MTIFFFSSSLCHCLHLVFILLSPWIQAVSSLTVANIPFDTCALSDAQNTPFLPVIRAKCQHQNKFRLLRFISVCVCVCFIEKKMEMPNENLINRKFDYRPIIFSRRLLWDGMWMSLNPNCLLIFYVSNWRRKGRSHVQLFIRCDAKCWNFYWISIWWQLKHMILRNTFPNFYEINNKLISSGTKTKGQRFRFLIEMKSNQVRNKFTT